MMPRRARGNSAADGPIDGTDRIELQSLGAPATSAAAPAAQRSDGSRYGEPPLALPTDPGVARHPAVHGTGLADAPRRSPLQPYATQVTNRGSSEWFRQQRRADGPQSDAHLPPSAGGTAGSRKVSLGHANASASYSHRNGSPSVMWSSVTTPASIATIPAHAMTTTPLAASTPTAVSASAAASLPAPFTEPAVIVNVGPEDPAMATAAAAGGDAASFLAGGWPPPLSTTGLSRTERLHSLANRILYSRFYHVLYAGMTVLSLACFAVSIRQRGCITTGYLALEGVVTAAIAMELGIRYVAMRRSLATFVPLAAPTPPASHDSADGDYPRAYDDHHALLADALGKPLAPPATAAAAGPVSTAAFWRSAWNRFDVAVVALCVATLLWLMTTHVVRRGFSTSDVCSVAAEEAALVDTMLLAVRNGVQLARLVALARRQRQRRLRAQLTGAAAGIQAIDLGHDDRDVLYADPNDVGMAMMHGVAFDTDRLQLAHAPQHPIETAGFYEEEDGF
ncbi:hypothetical protein CXG81DRAFT_27270 [Caulochytrium protostelioides]|uniref:Transmembrane protein n=1 Tax=Caulochytrium protostelioides TaxID=1555241 RepID=A0A4V1IUB6_9FUNG|nr:hypothetical protein CXG81DRAFT_27270 [Caulochytrium protostelioides]|eukprot:RKO99988.1 hypothetical protein CXG81DRAFT_27270 [Caulochytrium protostelioides]